MTPEEQQAAGLPGGHAYSVTDARKVHNRFENVYVKASLVGWI